jgi:phytoene desaturase
MYALIEAMTRLAEELGVGMHLDSPVEEILTSGGRARGVRVNGEEVSADAVVANADLPYVYRSLLGKEAEGDFRLRSRDKLKYTTSAFMLYLGVGQKLDHLRHHNFFLSGDYRRNFDQIFREGVLPEDPSFYVVVHSRTEPSMAPEGAESVFVLVPVPHLDSKVDWEKESEGFKEKIHGLLKERAGIEGVIFERVRTPIEWQQDYNLEKGAAFGIGHGILQVGYVRPPLASKSVERLYFVGASTHPGTGVPLVTIGAELTAERIGRDLG